MNKFLIYALTDPRDGSVRYIGKSSHGMERPRSHKNLAQRTDGKCQLNHCYNWVRQLLQLGLMYDVVVLEESPTGDGLSTREIWWIAFAREWGCRLTNLTNGGEGLSGYVWSDEQRMRLGVVVRAALARPEVKAHKSAMTREFMARPDVKAKQRKGLIAAYSDPVVRARMADAVREALADPVVSAKRKEIARKVHAAPEVRERHRAATIKSLANPEVKEKQRAGLRKAWADPEKRARIKDGMRRANLRPGVKEKQSASARALCSRPEVKAQRSASQRQSWLDPEIRKRRIAAMTSPEARAKQHAANAGRKRSSQDRTKITIGLRESWRRRRITNLFNPERWQRAVIKDVLSVQQGPM